MKIIYTMKKCNEKSEGFHIIFSVMNTFTVLHYECITPSSLSLFTTHIQALDIQCTLWSPKYTPNDILDISKNYHLLLRYLYLPYTLHWYFFGHAVIKNTWRFSEIFIQIICFSFLSFSLSNMALTWNCCQLTFQFF